MSIAYKQPESLPRIKAGQDAATITADEAMRGDFVVVCAQCGAERLVAALTARPQASFGSLLQCRACASPMNLYIDVGM